jgi:hypothetical protein
MKTLKKLTIALILTGSLACISYGGDQESRHDIRIRVAQRIINDFKKDRDMELRLIENSSRIMAITLSTEIAKKNFEDSCVNDQKQRAYFREMQYLQQGVRQEKIDFTIVDMILSEIPLDQLPNTDHIPFFSSETIDIPKGPTYR